VIISAGFVFDFLKVIPENMLIFNGVNILPDSAERYFSIQLFNFKGD